MRLRQTNIDKLRDGDFDVLIIGGGINGSVCAASLAGRGVRVGLIDQKDFGSETSQSSSNLIWGGIKYLESYEIPLVYKLCMSRNKLCRSFPSSVKEMRFFTIHNRNTKYSRWMLYCGTWLYWLIGNGFTKKPYIFSKKYIEQREPIVNTSLCTGGIEYSDAYLMDNDARFVFNFISSAIEQGAIVSNYTVAQKSIWEKNRWTTCVQDLENGEKFKVHSKIVINACGPHLDKYNEYCSQETNYCHIFSKGVHLTVNKITDSKKVLTFFADDGRMFFVIPMGTVSCVGTTDTRVETLPAIITDEDRNFILKNINALLKLKTPLTKEDIIAERCGVRPLVVKKEKQSQKADWLKLSRKHVVETGSNFINIFGGKLTDCLNIGDEVFQQISKMGVLASNPKRKWFGESSLTSKKKFLYQAQVLSISRSVAERLWRFYDIGGFELLSLIRTSPILNSIIIPEVGYLKAEAVYAAQKEIITHLEDFLRRRTILAMIMTKEQLRTHPGVEEVNKILFGEQQQQKWQEYFGK